jgi:hypothetical protein
VALSEKESSMKVRSTIHRPEDKIVAGDILDLSDDEAHALIAAGHAAEHVEGEPELPAHLKHDEPKKAAEPAEEAAKERQEQE